MDIQFEQLKKELESSVLEYESSIDSLKQKIKDIRLRLMDVNDAIAIKTRLGDKANTLPPKITIEWSDETADFCIYFEKDKILNRSNNSLCVEYQRLILTDYAWDLYDAYQQLFFDPSNKKDITETELSYDSLLSLENGSPAPGFEVYWRHRHDPFESHYELRFKNDFDRVWRPDLNSFDDQEEALIKKSWIIYDVLRNFHF